MPNPHDELPVSGRYALYLTWATGRPLRGEPKGETMRRSRLSGSVLCLLLGVLVSSCSGNGSRQVGGGQALAAAALSTTESAPLATPKEQLLLQQSDLPTGAQQEAIPPDALASQLSDGLAGLFRSRPHNAARR